MAIIRFVDKNNECYQVQSPENAILIYLTTKERQQILAGDESQCLMLVDGRLSPEDTQAKVEALNTKDQPKTLI